MFKITPQLPQAIITLIIEFMVMLIIARANNSCCCFLSVMVMAHCTLHSCNNLLRQVLWSPFYRCVNWDTETFGNLSKYTVIDSLQLQILIESKTLFMPAPLKCFIWLTHSIPVTILQSRWHYQLHWTSGEMEAKRKEVTTQSHTACLWDEGLKWERV